jgi:hypothetical protein
MTAALSPAQALDRLADLSAEIRAAVVLGQTGRRLAGSPAVAAPAAELLAAADAPEIEIGASRGVVYAVRGARHAIAVVATRATLPALMRYDLRAVLAEVEGGEK